MFNVDQFQLGSLWMEPAKEFHAALTTIFDLMIQANNDLRQQVLELRADCDRLAADRSDALKVRFVAFCTLFSSAVHITLNITLHITLQPSVTLLTAHVSENFSNTLLLFITLAFYPTPFCNACLDMYVRQAVELL